eukprot:scaffold208_cov248-Chaetoceros_neogracile.AAC.4
MSLCPQMRKRMGHSHFWEPGEEWEVHNDHWQILIDTDVSLAVQETAMREKRCGKFNSSAECPVSCSATDCIPFDTVGTFTFKGKERSCWWVANKNPKTRCKKDILRSNCCPMTCNGNSYDF